MLHQLLHRPHLVIARACAGSGNGSDGPGESDG
jgi:hypothetical protein